MEQSTLDNHNVDEFFSDIIEVDLDRSCSPSTFSGNNGPTTKRTKKGDTSWMTDIAREQLEQQKDHYRKNEEHDMRKEEMVEDLINTRRILQNDLLEVLKK
ncbi:GL12288 [Drosophila persimilis]|uniref:GL12288 n=1 Tax=Drosophila persimilis TaxID=7234 RepID=B4GMA3_DROPE|nr:uncharacterized protein LOC6594375 [Drosophila persimilis]EDW37977.1 GL12288 [Drosophila persimilis]